MVSSPLVFGPVDPGALIAPVESLPQPFGAALEGRIPGLP
jgi:hypothetical protein